jgi:hypothetical protein
MPNIISTPPAFYEMLDDEPLVVVLPPGVCPVPYPPVPCVPEPDFTVPALLLLLFIFGFLLTRR